MVQISITEQSIPFSLFFFFLRVTHAAVTQHSVCTVVSGCTINVCFYLYSLDRSPRLPVLFLVCLSLCLMVSSRWGSGWVRIVVRFEVGLQFRGEESLVQGLGLGLEMQEELFIFWPLKEGRCAYSMTFLVVWKMFSRISSPTFTVFFPIAAYVCLIQIRFDVLHSVEGNSKCSEICQMQHRCVGFGFGF